MAKQIYPLISGVTGLTDYLSSADDPLAGEEAPTTRWFNPTWDRWLELAAQASGGRTPVFGSRGSSLQKLPSSASFNALKQLVNQGWGDWQSLEAPRKKLENY